jgi:hypothetical protein
MVASDRHGCWPDRTRRQSTFTLNRLAARVTLGVPQGVVQGLDKRRPMVRTSAASLGEATEQGMRPGIVTGREGLDPRKSPRSPGLGSVSARSRCVGSLRERRP